MIFFLKNTISPCRCLYSFHYGSFVNNSLLYFPITRGRIRVPLNVLADLFAVVAKRKHKYAQCPCIGLWQYCYYYFVPVIAKVIFVIAIIYTQVSAIHDINWIIWQNNIRFLGVIEIPATTECIHSIKEIIARGTSVDVAVSSKSIH